MADYRQMWKDLNMDLETHDLLCEASPQAFGDVHLSQENRPEGMGYYNFVVSEIHGIRPAELVEAQKKGTKVFGTFCVYVPDFENHTQGLLLDELLRGAGMHATIVPTPRALSKSCGVALALREGELETVRTLIEREGAAVLASEL